MFLKGILTMLKEIISQNIVELRKDAGLTQAQLAEALNYSDKAVSKWERGDSLPDVVVLKQIADLFNVTVDYLLEEDHSEFQQKFAIKNKHIKRNHLMISLVAAAAVWFLSTFIFVALVIINDDFTNPWLILVYAIPLSAVAFLVFSVLWHQRRATIISISVLMWGLIAAIFFTWLTAYPLLFFIGIPGQLLIILATQIKVKPKIDD